MIPNNFDPLFNLTYLNHIQTMQKIYRLQALKAANDQYIAMQQYNNNMSLFNQFLIPKYMGQTVTYQNQIPNENIFEPNEPIPSIAPNNQVKIEENLQPKIECDEENVPVKIEADTKLETPCNDKKIPTNKKIKKINTCGHSDKPHYAKNLCYFCYQIHGRKKKPWKCNHDILYAKGLCQLCYVGLYNRRRKRLGLRKHGYKIEVKQMNTDVSGNIGGGNGSDKGEMRKNEEVNKTACSGNSGVSDNTFGNGDGEREGEGDDGEFERNDSEFERNNDELEGNDDQRESGECDSEFSDNQKGINSQ